MGTNGAVPVSKVYMGALLDIMPGLSMPVKEVTRTLAHMWDAQPESGAAPFSDFRASQLNLVLHFGLGTSPEEARERFDWALDFAQRYPARIICLCPEAGGEAPAEMTGKLFSQCYIGPNQRDFCCCEALILGYSPEQAAYLGDQLSLWLESDLPIHHWFHRVPAAGITEHYLDHLRRASRILIDRQVDGEAYDQVAWPDPKRVRDLATARMLPWRQNLGHFLGAFPPEILVDRLQAVQVAHLPGLAAEARCLQSWLRRGVEACQRQAKTNGLVLFACAPQATAEADLSVRWSYGVEDRFLNWSYRFETRHGTINGNLGQGEFDQPMHIEPLPPEKVLAEALFF